MILAEINMKSNLHQTFFKYYYYQSPKWDSVGVLTKDGIRQMLIYNLLAALIIFTCIIRKHTGKDVYGILVYIFIAWDFDVKHILHHVLNASDQSTRTAFQRSVSSPGGDTFFTSIKILLPVAGRPCKWLQES